ncbi:glucose-6-phosphate dehydrogenase (coenzyme-F420) [Homoserinibacter sp. YIM 151385]|uniref:glucose-6-phosphate dehydrogenase (coenzyme-F420) n=1 Tax=Homoserinibacter sp. YIM 151385 TaxID=2985506 RepID=UPI0022F0E036|nr:glucose-6-phosphate dehydrogenase (coenzyme-F420) [Homoserinibacter sp. YIM 151385]WBU39212.1 glucose-6-phosphate dehydrogenase (coenzyme-F420) [Homoserinibacter sp. YIM 151385]
MTASAAAPALTLGYKASAEQFDPRELVEIAVAAEAHGMESVAVSDHFQPWRHEGGHAPFSLAWMAAVGERTERIRLGTSVMTPTFRYNPAVVAQAFATMGCLYPERVFLGVGTGEALNEIATGFRGAGSQEWPEFKERFARLREAVRLMRALWTGDRVSFEGDYYSTHDASIYDVPDGGIPVYIAAGGPVVAKYAGRAGDGFICTSGKGMELYTEKLLPAVAEGAAAGERDAASIDRMIEIKLSYDTDHKRALESTRFWSPLALSKEQKHDITDPVEMERAADALPIEQIASRWIVGSDPDEVVEGIRPYVEAGLNHLVFHAPGQDQRRFLELFERDLAPRLRALS